MKLGNRILNIIALFAVVVGVASLALAQAVKPSVATGDVTSIDAGKIVLQTKDGSLDVVLSDKTVYKRVPPENPVLSAAVAAAFGDIGVGDKLVVSGIMSDDKKSLPARSVYIMTKADITQSKAKNDERWAKRGIAGRVTAVDPVTGQIKVEIKGLMNSTTVVLTPKAQAKFSRYAPDSIKFADAKPSTLNEIHTGDGLRAVGDRSADGASFAAEEIITGAFQTVAGSVKSVDVAKNQIVMTEAQSKKDMTFDLGSVSFMKKLPEEFAQRFAGGPGGARPGGGQGAPAGAGNGPARPAGGPGASGPGGVGARGIDEMVERFPNITAADLKPGEIIAVVTSKTNPAERMTAFKLLAGVEPFLRVAQAQAAASGGRGQGTLSLDIPGLDGFGGP
jgi:hypothetical protein